MLSVCNLKIGGNFQGPVIGYRNFNIAHIPKLLRTYIHVCVCRYFNLSLSFSFPSSLSVVTIGFDQTLYRVNEEVGAVEVCASVRGGVTLDREVVVQYSTADESAVGMKCLLL